MNTFRKFVATVISAATLLFALTACVDENKLYIASGDFGNIPVGVYLSAQEQAYSEFVSKYVAEQSLEETPEKSVIMAKETLVDGVTAAEFIETEALATMKEIVAKERKFEQYGLALSAEDQTYIENVVEQYSYYQESNDKKGIGETSIKYMVANSQKGSLLFRHLYYEGGENEVPRSEVESAINDIGAKVYSFNITINETAEPEREEAMIADLNTMVEDLKNGKDLAELANAFNKKYNNPESYTLEELTEYVSFDDYSTYPQEFLDDLTAAEVDVPFLTTAETTYAVSVRKDIAGDDVAYMLFKDAAIYNLKADEFDALIEQWGIEVTDFTYNQAAHAYYTPDKLVVIE